MSEDNKNYSEKIKKQGVTRSNPANKSFEKQESSEELKRKLSEKAKNND
ncbi:hypothetical protein NST64_08715 [Staphylococcus sp. FSL W8-1268]